MPADGLGVVARFAVEVLEQGHLEVLDELVDSDSEVVNWDEFKNLLATIKDEAPGLGLHIGDLDEHDGLVTGTLQLSMPVGFRVSGGRISDVELPEYVLPEGPAAADPGPEPALDRSFTAGMEKLRRAIDETVVELAGDVERFERLKRELAEMRDLRSQWEDRAARARERGDLGAAARAVIRAKAQTKLLESCEEELRAIGGVIERLSKYLPAAEERLLQFELRAGELEARRQFAWTVETLEGTAGHAGEIAEHIARMEAGMHAAETAAEQETTRVRNHYERRLALLRDMQARWTPELGERLEAIAEEVAAVVGNPASMDEIAARLQAIAEEAAAAAKSRPRNIHRHR